MRGAIATRLTRDDLYSIHRLPLRDILSLPCLLRLHNQSAAGQIHLTPLTTAPGRMPGTRNSVDCPEFQTKYIQLQIDHLGAHGQARCRLPSEISHFMPSLERSALHVRHIAGRSDLAALGMM